ncbi:MAG: glycosyltransferase [Lutibacter sp.]|nr:glycosyltransferase [Lutibacter sp.]
MGHATRCIPIINALLKANYEPVLASDGDALLLLQKEFPLLQSIELPSYNIKYPKNGKNLRFKLLLQLPAIISAIKKERKTVSELIKKENIAGIISDNRFGVFSKEVPSVYITHQLNVLSGKTTFITSKIHQQLIKKFDECWVPDMEGNPNFSGDLGHLKKHHLNLKYIGILSRFQPKELEIKYDLLLLLSGPEPQRNLLENKLLLELKDFNGKILMVRGVLKSTSEIKAPVNFIIVNYLLANELEDAINQSDLVISRSGYSTIMDFTALGKKAFFIPTPGQFEQEYLAKMLQEKLVVPYVRQDEFTATNLGDLTKYSGFEKATSTVDLKWFKLFEGK